MLREMLPRTRDGAMPNTAKAVCEVAVAGVAKLVVQVGDVRVSVGEPFEGHPEPQVISIVVQA